MNEYPPSHQQIVADLLEGKFLLYSEFKNFEILKKHEVFYKDFFTKTFNYELNIRNDFAYLSSEKTDEKLSRNFTIFLAILCYEINQKTTDFKGRIENGIFTFEEIEGYLGSEVFKSLISEIGIGNLNNFLRQLARRNIIRFLDKGEDKFQFTKAVHLFFEFAVELSHDIIKVNEE